MESNLRLRVSIVLVTILIIFGCKIIKQADDNKAIEVNLNEPLMNLVSLNEEVYQQEIYILPEEIEFDNNSMLIKDKVVWDKVAVTDTPGKYMYEGHMENYNYCVNLILNVKENIYDRKVGYIRNIFINNDKDMSIEFDSAEFFKDEEALYEAIKDNEVEIDNYGNFVNLCGYYIRNSSYDKEIFKINKFPVLELVEIEINGEQRGSGKLVNVDFETLKKYIDNYNNCDDEEKLLFYINIKNNEIVSIVRQYLEYN